MISDLEPRGFNCTKVVVVAHTDGGQRGSFLRSFSSRPAPLSSAAAVARTEVAKAGLTNSSVRTNLQSWWCPAALCVMEWCFGRPWEEIESMYSWGVFPGCNMP